MLFVKRPNGQPVVLVDAEGLAFLGLRGKVAACSFDGIYTLLSEMWFRSSPEEGVTVAGYLSQAMELENDLGRRRGSEGVEE